VFFIRGIIARFTPIVVSYDFLDKITQLLYKGL